MVPQRLKFRLRGLFADQNLFGTTVWFVLGTYEIDEMLEKVASDQV